MSLNNIEKCRVFGLLSFSTKPYSSSVMNLTVNVAPQLLNKVEKYTVEVCRSQISSKGFSSGEVPYSYVLKSFKNQIYDSCVKFIFKFFILDYLEFKIDEMKLVSADFPKLVEVVKNENGSVNFCFRACILNNITEDNWCNIFYSPPKRKMYKDLDRQAELFIKETVEKSCAIKKPKNIEDKDWVYFEVVALNSNNQPAFRDYRSSFWLNVNSTYVATPLSNIFLDKQEGETIVLNQLPMYGLPTDFLSLKGKFRVIIKKIIKSASFSFDLFKSAFGLKDQGSVHEKLIEIFSFRNDISQRRLIIEEAFRVLFSKIKFEVPKHLVIRRQEHILKNVQQLPDYNVYRSNSAFHSQVSSLSEKQIREEVLLIYAGLRDNVKIEQINILEYLNLLINPRLSEFIYFKPHIEMIQDASLPIREGYFARFVFREKVLNMMLSNLLQQKN